MGLRRRRLPRKLADMRLPVQLGTAVLATLSLTTAAQAATAGSTAGSPTFGCNDFSGAPCTVFGPTLPGGSLTSVSINTGGATSVTLLVMAADRSVRMTLGSFSVGGGVQTIALPSATAVTAGEHLGASFSDATRFAAGGGETQPVKREGGLWESLSGVHALLSAEVTSADGGGPAPSGGGPAPGGGGPAPAGGGPAPGGGGSRQDDPCPASPTRALLARTLPPPASAGTLVASPVAVAAGWRQKVLDRSEPYVDVQAAYSPKGTLHLVGRSWRTNRLRYLGTRGPRTWIGKINLEDPWSLTTTFGQGAFVGWGTKVSGSSPSGLLIGCRALRVAVTPELAPYSAASQPPDQRGFEALDVAGDPSTGIVHGGWITGTEEALHYGVVGVNDARLPLSGAISSVKVGAARGTVTVGAKRGRTIVLFTRSAKGSWSRLTIRGVHEARWDLAQGADGRPRVAFQDSRLNLALYNGRKLVRTDLPVDQVTLALDAGDRMHLAFTRTDRPRCFRFTGCLGNGLLYLRTNPTGTRGRVSTIAASPGQSSRLSIAVSGRKVAVAMLGHSSWPMVRLKG